MQILYQDSAAFPTMNKEELVRILNLRYFLDKFGKNDTSATSLLLSAYLNVRIIGLLGRVATPEIFNC